MIRKLFGERYGQRFAVSAVELFPGNLVNHEVNNLYQLVILMGGIPVSNI